MTQTELSGGHSTTSRPGHVWWCSITHDGPCLTADEEIESLREENAAQAARISELRDALQRIRSEIQDRLESSVETDAAILQDVDDIARAALTATPT